MLYRLFINNNQDGADIHVLLTVLNFIGEMEVQHEPDEATGAPALKFLIFKLLLSYIYKVNRLYTKEEAEDLEAVLNNLCGDIKKNIVALQPKLSRDVSDELQTKLDFILSTNHKVTENIRRIVNDAPALSQHITKEDGIIKNPTLLDESLLEQAALKISPPNRSTRKKVFEYLMSFFASAGTGCLFVWGLPFLGIAAIGGVALLAGGGVFYFFVQFDAKQKQQFIDTHILEMKDECIAESKRVAKKNLYLFQETAIFQSEQHLKSNEDVRGLKERHAQEIKDLEQQLETLKDEHEQKIIELNQRFAKDRHLSESTISKQQQTLLQNAETMQGLNQKFELILKYIQRIEEPQKEIDETESAENLVPNAVTITELPDDPEICKEDKPIVVSLPSADKALAAVRTLSAKLRKKSNPRLEEPPSPKRLFSLFSTPAITKENSGNPFDVSPNPGKLLFQGDSQ